MKTIISLIITLIVFVSCNKKPKIDKPIQEVISKDLKAEKIISKAILSHGGELYEHADYSFVFRGKKYRFINNNSKYTYSVSSINSESDTLDTVINGKFRRFKNKEEELILSSKDQKKYSNALNSVIYFATLPHKLKDEAVNKKFIETTIIKGLKYDVVEVTFEEEGGGEDHDDIFYYWINQETTQMDYLAYSYKVNNGGVRFRSAFNKRIIGGITFQDYINWKANIGTPLKDLPTLFEQNKLEEVSQILTENIINHKK